MSLTVDDGSPVTTDYAWDVNRSLPVVLDDGTNQYVYGLDLISATDASDDQTYFTYDGLGSTTALTDDTGAVTDTYAYDVFGSVRSRTGTSANIWEFTGEQTDEAAQLVFLRARFYDPLSGRFLTQDSFAGLQRSPQSQNTYSYALNNPTNFVDPSGHISVLAMLTAMRPQLHCGGHVDIACVGDFIEAISEYNDLVFEVLKACAIWGGGGFITGGWVGAAVGCAAGGASVLLEDWLGPNPYSECLVWGATGIGGGPLGVGIGCATGVMSYLSPSNAFVQCIEWGFGTAAGQTQLKKPNELGGLIGGCLSGGASALFGGSGESPSNYEGGGMQ